MMLQVGGGGDGRAAEHARGHPHGAGPVRSARSAQVAVRRLVQ